MQIKNNLSDYRQRITDAIVQNNRGGKTITSHRFNLVSANLFRFLPHVGFDQHISIYTDILLHNQLTHYEQKQADILNSVTVENASKELFKILKSKPCIFTSFHFGMYRLMNLFLTKNRIPYTIVIPKASLQKEGDIFRDIYKKMYPDASSDPIRFIEMESPSLSLKMIRELKQGRSLFIYFDGYRGAGNIQENKRYHQDGKITFLGQTLLARVGVAYLAQIAGVPLITGISYRKALDDLRLHFFDPVFPSDTIAREQFAHDTTQALYNQFSPFLAASPGQWEAWLYLHRSLPYQELSSVEPSVFIPRKNTEDQINRFKINHEEFGIFKIEESAYLFNKRTYTSYPIENNIFNFLETAIHQPATCFEHQYFDISALVANNVIVPSAA